LKLPIHESEHLNEDGDADDSLYVGPLLESPYSYSSSDRQVAFKCICQGVAVAEELLPLELLQHNLASSSALAIKEHPSVSNKLDKAELESKSDKAFEVEAS